MNYKHHARRAFPLAAIATLALAAAAGAAEPAFDAYLPASPQTVIQGVYQSNVKPAITIKNGQTLKIDTVNSTELNREDYLGVLKAGGVSASAPYIKETVAILSGSPPAELMSRSGRVGRLLTGPVYVEGAEPGDTLEVRVVDLAVQSDFAINRTITNMGHPLATVTPRRPRACTRSIARTRRCCSARTSSCRCGRISARWA